MQEKERRSEAAKIKSNKIKIKIDGKVCENGKERKKRERKDEEKERNG